MQLDTLVKIASIVPAVLGVGTLVVTWATGFSSRARLKLDLEIRSLLGEGDPALRSVDRSIEQGLRRAYGYANDAPGAPYWRDFRTVWSGLNVLIGITACFSLVSMIVQTFAGHPPAWWRWMLSLVNCFMLVVWSENFVNRVRLVQFAHKHGLSLPPANVRLEEWRGLSG